MMRRLLICFSAAVVASISPCFAATVGGNILIDGASAARSSQEVVVWLEPEHVLGDLPPTPARAKLLQKNKTFQPHLLAVGVNTLVDFPNADPIFHNAFSNYDGQIFDIGLYAPGTSRAVRFRRPGIVRIFCNIHPSMSAVIVVLDTPYFATVKPGSYSITNVEPGTYKVHVFDERATSDSDPAAPVTVTGDADEHVPDIHLSESGYVHLPHKNKYGLDYPPDADTYGSDGPPK